MWKFDFEGSAERSNPVCICVKANINYSSSARKLIPGSRLPHQDCNSFLMLLDQKPNLAAFQMMLSPFLCITKSICFKHFFSCWLKPPSWVTAGTHMSKSGLVLLSQTEVTEQRNSYTDRSDKAFFKPKHPFTKVIFLRYLLLFCCWA